MPLADHDMLIKKRKQELKHAQDVKELYEKKLERVNDLFMELNSWKLQLEEEERNLQRIKRQLNVQGTKVYYKKKMKPLVLSKAHERLQKRQKSAAAGGGVSSPEAEFQLSSPSRLGAAAASSLLVNAARPQVRINPLYNDAEANDNDAVAACSSQKSVAQKNSCCSSNSTISLTTRASRVRL